MDLREILDLHAALHVDFALTEDLFYARRCVAGARQDHAAEAERVGAKRLLRQRGDGAAVLFDRSVDAFGDLLRV